MRFPSLDGGVRNYSQTYVSSRNCSLCLFHVWWSFPSLGEHTHQHFPGYLGNSSAGLWEFSFCKALLSFQDAVLWTSVVLISPHFQLNLLNPSLNLPKFPPVAWKLSQGGKLRQPPFLPITQDSLYFVAWCLTSWKPCFVFGTWLFSCLGQEEKSSSYHTFLPGSRSPSIVF